MRTLITSILLSIFVFASSVSANPSGRSRPPAASRAQQQTELAHALRLGGSHRGAYAASRRAARALESEAPRRAPTPTQSAERWEQVANEQLRSAEDAAAAGGAGHRAVHRARVRASRALFRAAMQYFDADDFEHAAQAGETATRIAVDHFHQLPRSEQFAAAQIMVIAARTAAIARQRMSQDERAKEVLEHALRAADALTWTPAQRAELQALSEAVFYSVPKLPRPSPRSAL